LAAEHLEFVESFQADNKYLMLVAEHCEGGEHGPNPMQSESKANTELLLSTFFLAEAFMCVSTTSLIIGRTTAVSKLMDIIVP
jgi:hypothetical protein